MLTRKTVAELELLDDDGWSEVWEEMLGGGGLPMLFERRGWSWGAFGRWLEGHPERKEEFFKARAWAAEAKVHEALPIADGGVDVQRDKLKIDTRFRVAKSWDAATYGDRASQININASGGLVQLLAGMPHAGRVEREVDNRTQIVDSPMRGADDVLPVVVKKRAVKEKVES